MTREDFSNFPGNLLQYSTLFKANNRSLMFNWISFYEQKFIASWVSHMQENFVAIFYISEDSCMPLKSSL